jgi:hypothetical protein
MRLLFILSVALFSCTGTSNREDNTSIQDTTIALIKDSKRRDQEEVTVEKPAGAGMVDCYWQLLKRDTIVASLSQSGNVVTGKLSFDNFEKDGSSGMVTGKSENGIIKLWYSFESEGMKSVMEVWLKKQGDMLLRGIGDMNVRSDTAYFTNMGAVKFSESQVMKKIDCSLVPSKCKQ